MNEYDEEILLAKWLAGELSDAEQALVEQLPHFAELKEAVAIMNHLDTPQANLSKIKQNLDKNRASKHIRPLFAKRRLAVAAAVLIGVLTWFFATEKPIFLETGIAAHHSYTLPDHSDVILNAESSIQYYKNRWKKERSLYLKGQAFFNVEKGSTFTVQSSQGIVQVVGTQFDVLSRDGVFEVVCYEGKVRVTTSQIDSLLLPGKGVNVSRAGTHYFESEDKAPSWASKILTFRQKKLAFVFEELQRQFDLKIDYSNINAKKEFSGKVPLDDGQLALDIICKTMGLKYEFLSDNKRVVISQ
ncbi:MAG TPA: DUF4974 domain-containing protein [Saprospiraceae bacterium]|nr:DUF4974 domain-containing protein [Saprospiraceae bacterium]